MVGCFLGSVLMNKIVFNKYLVFNVLSFIVFIVLVIIIGGKIVLFVLIFVGFFNFIMFFIIFFLVMFNLGYFIFKVFGVISMVIVGGVLIFFI